MRKFEENPEVTSNEASFIRNMMNFLRSPSLSDGTSWPAEFGAGRLSFSRSWKFRFQVPAGPRAVHRAGSNSPIHHHSADQGQVTDRRGKYDSTGLHR
jgi:hypothetical protein